MPIHTQEYYRLKSPFDIDLNALDLHKIPLNHVWPVFDPRFAQAPDPVPENLYLKQPSLLTYGDTDASLRFDQLILHEAKICEILRRNPHPDIARYWGCFIRRGRIRGICFDKYTVSLSEWVKGDDGLDVDLCLRGIRNGVEHLHELGLAYNDLKPANIMMNGNNPIIIDFDSCKSFGIKLDLKAGIKGWDMGSSIAKPENDEHGLVKLGEWLNQTVKTRKNSSTTWTLCWSQTSTTTSADVVNLDSSQLLIDFRRTTSKTLGEQRTMLPAKDVSSLF